MEMATRKRGLRSEGVLRNSINDTSSEKSQTQAQDKIREQSK